MVRIAVLGLSLIVVAVEVGCAQDIAGIEDYTKTSGLDKRTGCLQSNVNFLQRLVTKNALDARNKLEDAASEIVALKGVVRPRWPASTREHRRLTQKGVVVDLLHEEIRYIGARN